jgi:hypothetical protein
MTVCVRARCATPRWSANLSVRADRFGSKRRRAESGVHVPSHLDDWFGDVLEALARQGGCR